MIDIHISETTNRAKSPTPPGIAIVKSTKQHAWTHALRIEHPDLPALLQQHHIDQLTNIAEMDIMRCAEAGHIPAPTTTPRKHGVKKLSWGFLTEDHAKSMAEIAARYMAELARNEGMDLRFIRYGDHNG